MLQKSWGFDLQCVQSTVCSAGGRALNSHSLSLSWTTDLSEVPSHAVDSRLTKSKCWDPVYWIKHLEPTSKKALWKAAAENSVMFLPGRLSQFGSEKLGEIKVPLSQSCSTQAVITLATGCQCCDGLYPCQAHLHKENICVNFTHSQTVKNSGKMDIDLNINWFTWWDTKNINTFSKHVISSMCVENDYKLMENQRQYKQMLLPPRTTEHKKCIHFPHNQFILPRSHQRCYCKPVTPGRWVKRSLWKEHNLHTAPNIILWRKYIRNQNKTTL